MAGGVLNPKKTGRLEIRMSVEALRKLQQKAKKKAVPVSRMVRDAAMKEVDDED